MRDSILGDMVFVIGLFLGFLAVIWTIILFSQELLAEYSVPLAIIVIIALVCLLYGGKEGIS